MFRRSRSSRLKSQNGSPFEGCLFQIDEMDSAYVLELRYIFCSPVLGFFRSGSRQSEVVEKRDSQMSFFSGTFDAVEWISLFGAVRTRLSKSTNRFTAYSPYPIELKHGRIVPDINHANFSISFQRRCGGALFDFFTPIHNQKF